jgi:hypothetical protein
MTAWPRFVFDLYNGEHLVRRVHKQMQNLKLFTQPGVSFFKVIAFLSLL